MSPATGSEYPVDDVDRALLDALRRDARMSIRGLARQIGMSAGAVGERIERLEKAGVIIGYRAEIDLAKVGLPLEVLVGIQLAQTQSLSQTVDDLLSIPEVAGIDIVTGRWDLTVRLRLRDQQHLRDILIGKMWRLQDFRHSESMLVLATYNNPAPHSVRDNDSSIPPDEADRPE